MTRGHRIVLLFVLAGLLMPGSGEGTRAQDTTALADSPKTFTISGKLGVAGVSLGGFPGSSTVVTDDNGVYSVEVPQGWSGRIQPEKKGYSFQPQFRTYTSVSKHLAGEDYAASLIVFAISGSVGVPGVAIKGLPGEVMTNRDGSYSAKVPYGWTGTVTPVRIGYRFNPPAREYLPLREPHHGQDYVATILQFTISGNAGVPGATIQGLPGGPVVTDERGEYRAKVEYGWSGKIVPIKVGYGFVPPDRTYMQVRDDLADQNYTAREMTYEISGSTGLPGVLIQGFPQSLMTDSMGRYRVSVPHGWSGVVVPQKEGYVFEPTQRQYPKAVGDNAGQDYRASIITFTISGQVGVPGVLMQGLPGSPVTDPQGAYRAVVPYGWAGVVVPEKAGYVFTPPARTYRCIVENHRDSNFAAEQRMVTISNVIMYGDEPIEGVRLTAEPGGYSVKTDSQGRYRIKVPYGWSGRLVPFAEDAEDIGPFFNVTSDIIDGKTVIPSLREQMPVISNVITFNGEPVQGLTLVAEPGGYSAITDSAGRYTIRVPYGWSGQLIPQGSGSRTQGRIPPVSYVNVTSDIIDGNRHQELDLPVVSSRMPQGLPPAAVSSPLGDVLVIPTADTPPEVIAATTEDLRVMLHILREKLSEPRMILGVLRDYGGFFDADRRVEALYLQGTAVIFAIEVDFPYSFPTQRPSAGRTEREAVDPVWERARQRLHAPVGARAYGRSGQTQEMSFEQFQEELLRSLRHAANVRHIDPNELVILTIIAQNEETGLPGSVVSGGAVSGRTGTTQTVRATRSTHGSAVSGRTGTTPVLDPYGKPRLDALGNPVMRPGPTPGTTVLTMQAKKADVDAFARGDLDFEQFRQKVRTFAY